MSENDEKEPTYRITKKDGRTITFNSEGIVPMMKEAVKYVNFIKEHCPDEHNAALKMLKEDEAASNNITVTEGYRIFVIGLCAE